MIQHEIKPSILLSIFKRKGGEGLLTRIIYESNDQTYVNQLALLEPTESALICCRQDESNWVLLTDKRILEQKGAALFSLYFTEMADVTLALRGEQTENGPPKGNFTRLKLKDKQDKEYIISVEAGASFQGLLQVLHYIIGKK
ncbi:hypothetical protein CK934_21375 [Chitinophaga sp. MD30]|nr:hypothetical protein CK934_21375 [Chitinophaga sp. MD30]